MISSQLGNKQDIKKLNVVQIYVTDDGDRYSILTQLTILC